MYRTVQITGEEMRARLISGEMYGMNVANPERLGRNHNELCSGGSPKEVIAASHRTAQIRCEQSVHLFVDIRVATGGQHRDCLVLHASCMARGAHKVIPMYGCTLRSKGAQPAHEGSDAGH